MDNERTDLLWTQVHTLTVLAQTGSFTKTAQRLGVSKAAVSQRLADLERAVGQKLVQRTTRSMRLTDAGEQLVEEAHPGFASILRSVVGLRDAVGQPRGLVRLTAPVALGRQHIGASLNAWLPHFPEIRVELDLSDRIVHLDQEGFDLAIRHTSAPPDNNVAVRLCSTRTVLVGSAAYLRRRGVPQHPGDLASHECLTYPRGAAPVWRFERREAASGRADPQRLSVPVRGCLAANNSESLREAAIAGLGLALLPDFSAAAALKTGRLREVLADWQPVGFFGEAIYAVRPWSAAAPRPVALLVEHLRSVLSAGFDAA